MGSPTLDVVTVNLWGDNGPAGQRMADLGAWLGDEQPDVVLLQEVEHVARRGQAELLADTGGHPHAETVRTGRGVLGGEGLGILSRHPLRPLAMVRLPRAARDHPRALQLADLVTPDGTVRIANTHLAWRLGASAARARQARAVVDALWPVEGPVILGGDLNDVPGSPPLQTLAEAGFTDCCASEPAATFDAGNPFLWQPELAGRRIDHLLTRGLAAVTCHVVLDGSHGPVVSDHYGVRAVVRL